MNGTCTTFMSPVHCHPQSIMENYPICYYSPQQMNQEMFHTSNPFNLSGYHLNLTGGTSTSEIELAGAEDEWKGSGLWSMADNELAIDSDTASMDFMLDLARIPDGLDLYGSKNVLLEEDLSFDHCGQIFRDAFFPGVRGDLNKAAASASYRLYSRGVEAGDVPLRQIESSFPLQDLELVRTTGCSASLDSPPAVTSCSPESNTSIIEASSVLDLAISPLEFSQTAYHHHDFVAAAAGPIMLGGYCEIPHQKHCNSQLVNISSDAYHFQASSDIRVLSPNPGESLPSPSKAWVEPLLCGPESKADVTIAAGEGLTSIISDSCSDGSVVGSPTAELSSVCRQEGRFWDVNTRQRDKIHEEEVGVELVNLLLSCGEAVSSENLSFVNPLMARLGLLASPEGSSMQRVAAYFTEGLACRISRTWPQVYDPFQIDSEIYQDDNYLAAYHILNHVCPYIKFAHYTANDVIVQAFEGEERVHIIDFDIKQGLQWPALFHTLASRSSGPPAHVRITGIGECKEDVQETGARLAEFADALNLSFEFHAVIDKLEDVRLWMLHVKDKESVAVNCVMQLHQVLQDSGNGIKEILELIKSTKPKVVALVEQEASHNGPTFQNRFLEALQYYAAIFDSLDSILPPASDARTKVEQLFAKEIRNILACEGTQRVVRHEKIERWSDLMTQAGFMNVPITPQTISQARLLLEMFSCKNYTLKETKESIMLGWLDKVLYSASAWSPRQ